jgi:hypothetical protein
VSRSTLDAEGGTTSVGQRVARLGAVAPVESQTLAALLALLPVAGATLYRVGHNAPGTLPPVVVDLAAVALPLAVAGPAVAALLLAATVESRSARLGLAFVGAFGLVSLAGGAAWFPAAVGVCAGLLVLVGDRVRRAVGDEASVELARTGLLGLLTAGVVVSLAATAGLAPGTLRPAGSALALLGVGLLPAVVPTDRLDLLAGTAAGLLTVAVAASVPYVAGAVLLVGGGVVGVPIGLVALAVGGGVAALFGGLRPAVTALVDTGESARPVTASVAVAPALLLAAGVPGTVLRAVGVAVAVGLLAGGDSR